MIKTGYQEYSEENKQTDKALQFLLQRKNILNYSKYLSRKTSIISGVTPIHSVR